MSERLFLWVSAISYQPSAVSGQSSVGSHQWAVIFPPSPLKGVNVSLY